MGTLQYGIISQAIILAQEKPLGERLKTASLNTVLGMGIVFAVLILIILTIYLLKIIPYLQSKHQNKDNDDDTVKSADHAIAQIVEQEEEELRDNSELVAVITAAICASMKEEAIPSNGLVVRSIRKISSRRRA